MTEPTDLIERLRRYDGFLKGSGTLLGIWFGDRNPDERGAFWWRKWSPITEAADEIATLRDRVAALEGALGEAAEQLWHLAKDPDTNPLVKELTSILSRAQQGGGDV